MKNKKLNYYVIKWLALIIVAVISIKIISGNLIFVILAILAAAILIREGIKEFGGTRNNRDNS